uniref:Large ribosomal subunit protein bL20c n=1 Tax=Aegilops tauschii subsp. strangulata TaxID=200361 RepID=A0A453NW52_AEGTS
DQSSARIYSPERRTKMRSFASNFSGAHLRLNRMITQQVKSAFVSSHRDRGRQKEGFSSFVDHSDKRSNAGYITLRQGGGGVTCLSRR